MVDEAVVSFQIKKRSSIYQNLTLRIKADSKKLISISTATSYDEIEGEINNGIILEAIKQLKQYFEGERKLFDLPIDSAQGTDFQKRVWKALRNIPYGETRTYGEIAAEIGSPKGARAVGMACNKNPLLIVTPCHRVIGSNGSLTGYACGLDVKQQLLAIETVEM